MDGHWRENDIRELNEAKEGHAAAEKCASEVEERENNFFVKIKKLQKGRQDLEERVNSLIVVAAEAGLGEESEESYRH